MMQDVRYALRQLARTPVFTVIAILTFALGVGANTAIFSVLNAVVLRRLPVASPAELVFLHATGRPPDSTQTGYNDTSFSRPVFEQLRDQKKAFSELMAYVPLGLWSRRACTARWRTG